MKKYVVLFLSALFLFALAPVASANFDVVKYDDTHNTNVTNRRDGFDVPEGDSDPVDLHSVIINGDFTAMPNGQVDCSGGHGVEAVFAGWCSWANPEGNGYESANLADVDLSILGSIGGNRGMGWFISNTGGGNGGYYAGAYQPLNVPAGLYFISISETAWYFDDLATGPYNSVAWYAISNTADHNQVTQWRELNPSRYQCQNSWERCDYSGRDEMVTVNTGDYLHLKVGHKFPEFMAKTVFIFDDIFMVPDGTHETVGPQNHGFYTWAHATQSIKDGGAIIENLSTGAVSGLEVDSDFKIHNNEVVYYSGQFTTFVTVNWNENASR